MGEDPSLVKRGSKRIVQIGGDFTLPTASDWPGQIAQQTFFESELPPLWSDVLGRQGSREEQKRLGPHSFGATKSLGLVFLDSLAREKETTYFDRSGAPHNGAPRGAA